MRDRGRPDQWHDRQVAADQPGQRATDALLSDRCEALILIGPQAPAARLDQLAAQLPVICLARRLPAAPSRPTAVLAFNDQCAAGLLDVFLRAGVPVPGQISVVGFDDSHLARLAHINLTTVSQDIPGWPTWPWSGPWPAQRRSRRPGRRRSSPRT
ncbi:MAG TPA: substrate-binding domain-containing protein [Streptosporangiaceae bacterium]|nr:substrate-binding domain-containing protein [Streptosporangiaceae bacterium]